MVPLLSEFGPDSREVNLLEEHRRDLSLFERLEALDATEALLLKEEEQLEEALVELLAVYLFFLELGLELLERLALSSKAKEASCRLTVLCADLAPRVRRLDPDLELLSQ